MKFKQLLWAFFLVSTIALTLFLEEQKHNEQQRFLKKMETAAQTLNPDVKQQAGYIKFFESADDILTEADMQGQAKFGNQSGYFWGGKYRYDAWGNRKDFMPGSWSKEGTDGKQHFVNSYLLGVHPFKVDNPALPLYALAQRKVYQLDDEQYGRSEVWQNSAEAFINLRGDCEDHAIVLADWLISEGIDAKVVAGSVPQGYHAWVVATLNGQEFILEATSKRYGNSWQHYPLASLNTTYEPDYMFNREGFWVNTDKHNITQYSGSYWQPMSTFHRQKPENREIFVP